MDGKPPEPWGIYVNQESVYGPEGKTYKNVCQFRSLNSQKSTNISRKHKKDLMNQVIQNPYTIHLIFKFIYLFWERESVCTHASEGGAERERERENPK